MGVQACRLPALKPSKLHPAATHPAANSHPAPHINRFFWPLLLLHPTATPRPHINGFLWASKATHQCLLMGIQVCRFILQPTATPRHTSMASCGHSCSQQAPQGHTSMASSGRPRLPFASPPRATHQCRLPALKPFKPSKRSTHLETLKR